MVEPVEETKSSPTTFEDENEMVTAEIKAELDPLIQSDLE